MLGSVSNPLTALIVDDEKAARGMLRRRLEAFEDVRVVGESDDGISAIALINQLKPDLVFLDIQMPEVTGFDVLPYLKERPMIVFCSAHDQYAIQAFEEQALDYLLKPVSHDRLAQCLERVKRQHGYRVHFEQKLEKLICHHRDSYQVVWLREVRTMHKEGRYTAVVTNQGSVYLTDLTLDELESQLPSQFFRVNRSGFVRHEVVQRMRLKPSGSGEVLLDDGSWIPLAKQRIQSFRVWLAGPSVH